MKASDLILNIAVNLERLSRWSSEGNVKRVEQFLAQTQNYMKVLKGLDTSVRFRKTLVNFEDDLEKLGKTKCDSPGWAERALTWANILTHRAKLA